MASGVATTDVYMLKESAMNEEYLNILIDARRKILAAYGTNPLSAGIAYTLTDIIEVLSTQTKKPVKLKVVK